jgi:xanthine dehydrogenase accessory factor
MLLLLRGVGGVSDSEAIVILHQPLLERIVAEVEGGRRVALCAVVRTHGSTPQSPGALLVVDEGMQSTGTLGGGCVEAEVCKRAFELLRADQSGLLRFQLDHDFGWDDGLVCGGAMDVAVMPIAGAERAAPFRQAVADMAAAKSVTIPVRVLHEGQLVEYRVFIEAEPTLLIAGAGHVGTALAKMAVDLEFKVVVVDDRPDFANSQRLPPPIEPIAADIEGTLRDYPIDAATYVVIVTRGHRHDEQALLAVIEAPAKYVGMIGSRRKIKTIFDDLKAAGVRPELLERVHSPIGLKINAMTVPEIAVSIAAELIATRRTEKRKVVEGPMVVSPGDEP